VRSVCAVITASGAVGATSIDRMPTHLPVAAQHSNIITESSRRRVRCEDSRCCPGFLLHKASGHHRGHILRTAITVCSQSNKHRLRQHMRMLTVSAALPAAAALHSSSAPQHFSCWQHT
jgi:hypothetical protein